MISLINKNKEMKKILLFALALFALASCTEEDALVDESVVGKEYLVSIGFSGEIEISHSPLTKAGTNDLYGVQVYSKESGDSEYAPYAYGLFDNTSDMKVKLIGGYQYKFVASMVEDGKDRIYHTDKGFSHPFEIGAAKYSRLENMFIYSSDSEMGYLNSGATFLYSSGNSISTYYRPNISRYYGELSGFTPSENKSASIDMKRVCFGAKFVAKGFMEGRMTIQIPEAPTMTINYPETEVEDIFTFKNDYGNGWLYDGYQEDLEVSITWTKGDGTVVPISNRVIEFVRNELTTVTINLGDDPTTDTNINTNLEMTIKEEEMAQGENVVINKK